MKFKTVIFKKILLPIFVFYSGNSTPAQCLINQDFATYFPTNNLLGSCGGSVDVQNNGGSYWGINEFSMDGNAYLGMHPELFGTSTTPFEYVSFPLSMPMVIGTSYTGSFYQAIGMLHALGGLGFWASENLGNVQGFFKVFAGNSLCDTAELIYSSTIVANESAGWVSESFVYTATNPYTFITVIPLGIFPGDSTPYMLFDDLTFCEIIGLPINLISLNAEWLDENKTQVVLNWHTSSETNNDFYTIERSVDLVNWNEIGIVNGAGNSISLLQYIFIDDDLSEITTLFFYYRIKQTDFDGEISYTMVKSIANIKNDKLNLWPNPTSNNLELILPPGSEMISFFSAIGELVLWQNIDESSDLKKTKIDISNLSKGLYILEIMAKNKIISTKIIKQ